MPQKQGETVWLPVTELRDPVTSPWAGQLRIREKPLWGKILIYISITSVVRKIMGWNLAYTEEMPIWWKLEDEAFKKDV